MSKYQKNIVVICTFFILLIMPSMASAAPLVPIPNINIGVGAATEPKDVALSLQILLTMTVLTLAPSILIMMTSFTRIIVVLSFLRSALATQQMPPNQVLIGMTEAIKPMREFMFKQTRENDLALFVNLSEGSRPNSPEDVPTTTLIPSFIISELKTAFQIGFLIYIPFIVIDMVVASTLMSMGMMMLPPVMISLPFKLLLFILVDGWHLIIFSLIHSFH